MTIENVKSKRFFTINSYGSNFTLYNIPFILASLLLFAKHFFIPKRFHKNIWWVYYVIYFFNYWIPWRMYACAKKKKKKETWNCEICEISTRTNIQNLFKVNNKSLRNIWMMLFRCLYHQLQRCGYWEPSQTSTINHFLQFKGEKLIFSTGF